MHSDIPIVWKDYNPNLHKWLLCLKEDFDLTFHLPKEPVNIVPCLLPTEEPEDVRFILALGESFFNTFATDTFCVRAIKGSVLNHLYVCLFVKLSYIEILAQNIFLFIWNICYIIEGKR